MSTPPALSAVLQDHRLYRGGRPLAADAEATPSGFAALDDYLPWGGFPRGALTEILLAQPGLGEFALLAPALARIGASERVVLVGPPAVPYAPALLQAGLPLQRLYWIEGDAARGAWAAEQCLRAGCVGAVALWSASGDDRQLRRLQLAASEGRSHGFLLRPLPHAGNPSPAALRLQLEGVPGRLRLRVLKCRGALPPAQPFDHPRDA
jgi:hypothetical protein